MAGTYTDQATLASMNEFIEKVRVAMVKRAIDRYYSTTAQTFSVLEQSRDVLKNGANEAPRVALLVAVGDSTISAGAPTVPTDAQTLAGVNLVMDALLK